MRTPVEELQNKIFSECQEILVSLRNLETEDELISKIDDFQKLAGKVYTLKILKENPIPHTEEPPSQNAESEALSDENLSQQKSILEDEISTDESQISEENAGETILEKTEELPELQAEPETLEEDPKPEIVEEAQGVENIEEEIAEEELIAEAALDEDLYEKNVEIREKEIEKDSEVTEEQRLEAEQKERKIKLANIKGLHKNIPSLFDDHFNEPEPAENFVKANPPQPTPVTKQRPDFKLDLNDRISFTQKLFGGSQTELNETVQQLNSFDNLDDAKEFLSDIYYRKNWKKADDFAQRLWTLVENKFL